MSAIRATGLTRRFGERVAVDALDLNVARGEVFGFLGPNGAGKTTTVRVLCGLLRPDAGDAEVAGCSVLRDPAGVRRRVGILTETPGLYDGLSVYDNLAYFAELYGVADVRGRVTEVLCRFDLWDRRRDPAAVLSKGMRQKLAIARAIVHAPEVVFLDEPTAALDPESAVAVRDLIQELRTGGATIFLCTHHLAEAERLCDRVAVFRGRVLAVDTPAGLRAGVFGQEVRFVLGPAEEGDRMLQVLAGVSGVASATREGDGLTAVVEDARMVTPVAVRALVAAGADLTQVAPVERTLEDVYFEVVRRAGVAP